MTILAVDDEMLALRGLEKAIRSARPEATIFGFCSPYDALEFVKDQQVDVAFLDVEMGEMNGLFLAKQLKEIYPDTNIIFVTGYADYMPNAFELHASGYLLKPVEAERVRVELDNLRRPVKREPTTDLHVQCFGNFEVFMAGQPLVFGRAKSKEIFAYLVDRRGAKIDRKELAAVLWEDVPYTRSLQAQLSRLLSELVQTLEEAGAQDVVRKDRSFYSVDTAKISCDFLPIRKG